MNLFGDTEDALPVDVKNYTVLARKYRPTSLDGLIGQDALVRTLRNALKTGRLAHAFLLTGIRGVGKTTTARIIARAINNIADNDTLDGHIDIIEMDAASNRGIDDIREIIGESRYKPVELAYKFYIIDEVHMLTKEAFNALLKTLEEPPPHVKFIFATTEIKKVPVTILSRCQRFDLRRVDSEVLTAHLKSIAAQEKIEIDDAAVRMLVTASEGSVRDSLSLLDQAIAYSENKIASSLVAEMLGYADKTQVIRLFEQLLVGQIGEALETFANVCQTSSEPAQLIHELLEFCHLVTRLKITPTLILSNVTENEANKARELANKTDIALLSRIWQMLLKAHGEIKNSPNPRQSGEMAMIRISYASNLTDPAELIADLKKKPSASLENKNFTPVFHQLEPKKFAPQISNSQISNPVVEAPSGPKNFNELIDLFRQHKELLVHASLISDVHLISFKPERLEIRLNPNAPKELPNKIISCLNQWTGKKWAVIISGEIGEPTLEEQAKQNFFAQVEAAKNLPIVKEILESFPGAVIKSISKIKNLAPTDQKLA